MIVVIHFKFFMYFQIIVSKQGLQIQKNVEDAEK